MLAPSFSADQRSLNVPALPHLLPGWSAYALTLPMTLGALAVTMALPASDRNPSFMLFLLATTLVAATGRWKAALLTVLESALLVCYFVLPPRGFSVDNPDHQLRLALFVLCGVALSLAVAHLISSRVALETTHPAVRIMMPKVVPTPVHGIDSSAQVDPSAALGKEVTIRAEATIAAGARIGDGAFVGLGTTVGAGAILGTQAQVADGCRLGESVMLGSRAEIGAGAVLARGVRVGPNAKIPPSAKIVEDVPAPAWRCSFL